VPHPLRLGTHQSSVVTVHNGQVIAVGRGSYFFSLHWCLPKLKGAPNTKYNLF